MVVYVFGKPINIRCGCDPASSAAQVHEENPNHNDRDDRCHNNNLGIQSDGGTRRRRRWARRTRRRQRWARRTRRRDRERQFDDPVHGRRSELGGRGDGDVITPRSVVDHGRVDGHNMWIGCVGCGSFLLWSPRYTPTKTRGRNFPSYRITIRKLKPIVKKNGDVQCGAVRGGFF